MIKDEKTLKEQRRNLEIIKAFVLYYEELLSKEKSIVFRIKAKSLTTRNNIIE